MVAYNVNNYAYSNPSHSQIAPAYQDELWAAEQCRHAITCLERALIAPPLHLTREAGNAARSILIVQDQITEWLRQDRKSDDLEHYSNALVRLNNALTLIEGLKYPSSGVRRKPIEQARNLLQSILVDGLL